MPNCQKHPSANDPDCVDCRSYVVVIDDIHLRLSASAILELQQLPADQREQAVRRMYALEDRCQKHHE